MTAIRGGATSNWKAYSAAGIPSEALKKVASDGQTRRNQVKKRSLQVVNEHFERDFNAVWLSAVVFQSFPRETLIN
ncbi:MAG: hypothetical protein JSR71_05290 [Proteobacteria bacterium]|nr:hypothetical protein [Pseudomonadota bacterium]